VFSLFTTAFQDRYGILLVFLAQRFDFQEEAEGHSIFRRSYRSALYCRGIKPSDDIFGVVE
jgi:hypothetical protein